MKAWIYCSYLFIFSLVTTQAEEIRMAASDLLADYISPQLKAFAEEKKLDLKIEGLGSLPAMERLKSDEIDLAIIAVPEGEDVAREEFSIYPFAYDAAVIVVNSSNPMDEISIPRLGGIFGTNEEFNFNTWGELGLTGWGTRNIKPLAGPSEGSVSLELFRHSVFTGGGMKSSVSVIRDTELEEALKSNVASIGVISALPKSKNLKVLMVSKEDGTQSPAFGPTLENIHLGDYPLRLSFYIVFRPDNEEKVKDVVGLLLRDEIAAALIKNKLFSLPEAVRNQLLSGLNYKE
ncbi:MAG: PstS family phosphate ABC transporter substrate-binding protein [Opitutales bacterium]